MSGPQLAPTNVLEASTQAFQSNCFFLLLWSNSSDWRLFSDVVIARYDGTSQQP